MRLNRELTHVSDMERTIAVVPQGLRAAREERLTMRTPVVLVFAAAVLTLCGCATIRRDEAASTEELLAAAGFQVRPADKAERIDDLQGMPPRKLVARKQDAKVTYTFADPYTCRCLYVGGAKEYSAYQRLAREKRIEEERLNDGEPMDGLWGPLDWHPWDSR